MPLRNRRAVVQSLHENRDRVFLYRRLTKLDGAAPLLHDQTGRRMAKRDGSDSLQQLRARGLSAEEVTGMLAAGLGWVKPGTAPSAGELLGEFGGEGDFIRALRRYRWNRNG